ncbi:hypothetical protein HOLleu_26385 [Holothuria leucospilota]|uniref:Uncharacterized protein n=1 Tax=Holothuria leucospilota TaxID=206669 RepID=A0A9Q1BP11_HOLLE|nr:hypothetical protein HOLleu_26385 [Holothuria leucospilota]
MLVLYNYEYGNYLKNIWKEVTKMTGDHDVMAICQQIGIILFQVKGCKGTLNRKLLQEAAVQLLKDKYVIFESNRDVPFVNSELPVYSFIALPHNNPEQIDKCLCDAHKFLILNSSHLEGDDSFREWFLKSIPIPQSRESYPFQGEDGLQYKLLCGRYISNFSCVSLPTLCEGIKKAGQQIQLYCFNLTPSQAFVMKSQKPFVIITGDFGTGKSLLLALKAQHLAKNGGNCHVNLLTCSNASGFVSENLKNTYQSLVHIRKLIGEQSNLTVTSFEIIPKSSKSKVGLHFIQELKHHLTKRHNGRVHHLFLDEVPKWLFQQCSQVIRDIATYLPDGTVFWISLATQSYKVTPGDIKVVDQITEFIPEFKNDILYLNEIMRMPKNLFLLHKKIGIYTHQGHISDAVCGYSIPGPKPLVYTLPKLTLHTYDSNENFVESVKSFEKVRIQKAFDHIFKKIGYPKDDSDIVVLVFFFFTDTFINELYTKLYNLLDAALKELHVKLRWKTLYTDSDEEKQGEDMFGKDKPVMKGERQGGEEEEDRVGTVLVVDDDSFIGCQAREVICVDPFSMFHWFPDNEGLGWDALLLTRCLSQYVHIAWPKEEASQLWQDHLEEWERDIFLRSPHVSKPNNDYRLGYITKAKHSKGECLEMLKKEGLLEEIGPSS